MLGFQLGASRRFRLSFGKRFRLGLSAQSRPLLRFSFGPRTGVRFAAGARFCAGACLRFLLVALLDFYRSAHPGFGIGACLRAGCHPSVLFGLEPSGEPAPGVIVSERM